MHWSGGRNSLRIVRHHLEKEGWLMFLFAKLKMYLVAAGAVVAALSVAYLRGRSAEAKAERERERIDYIETRRRIDAAAIDSDDPDDARAWLRKRQQSGDM